jgi:hypothetical protein
VNGELAQLVALTCHANAALAGRKHAFFPEHSTCRFCQSVAFVGRKHRLFRSPAEVTVAQTPDEWFALLAHNEARGVALTLRPATQEPLAEERMLSAFAGGGGIWGLEVIMPTGYRQRWVGRWETDDREAADQRMWRVKYGWTSNPPGGPPPPSALTSVSAQLERALVAIRSFAERRSFDSFVKSFSDALRCLDDATFKPAYHRDLYDEPLLPARAAQVLQAAQCAWVFGGMGSWNDMSFEGEIDAEYRRLSDNLFIAVHEAIIAAANASLFAPTQAAQAGS